jgi:hypothetical protein
MRFDRIPGDQHLTVAIPLVTNFNRAPVLDYIGPHTVVAGDTLTFNVRANDPDGTPPHLLVKDLPPGASFVTNGAEGVFSWPTIIADLGEHSVTFRAYDGQLADSETVLITVADDEILWCNLQWPYSVASQATLPPGDTIYGRVLVPGKTAQSGPAPGLTAQLGYGRAAEPVDSWTWFDAEFGLDKDDGSDEFQSALPGEIRTGTFYYAYRYRYTPQGSAWQYGTRSQGPVSTVAVADAGVWEIAPIEDRIYDANLQWPPAMTTEVSQAPPVVYGRVYIPGVTLSNTPSPNLTVFAGYGADASAFQWYAATLNTTYGWYAEYRAQFPAEVYEGTYYYAFSNVYHGSNMVFGLLHGMSSVLDTEHAGRWYVIPEPAAIAAAVVLAALRRRGPK